MKHLCRALVLVVLSLEAYAAPDTLQELLDHVRQERTDEQRLNRERIERFTQARDRQAELLEEARAALATERERAQRLEGEHARRASKIMREQARLDKAILALGEVQSTFGRVAADAAGLLTDSIISAQNPERRESAKQLAAFSEVPSPDALRQLWQLLLEEIVESGRVTRFVGPVITGDGRQDPQTIVRVGTFNLVADGNYLKYLPETGAVMEPLQRPSSAQRDRILKLEHARSGTVPLFLDPTLGTLLALLRQAPDLVDRIRQGGPVGYVIIALGVIGLIIALERFVIFAHVGRRMSRQLQAVAPDPRNPLGRILGVYANQPDVDLETLSLKLDEAILAEIPTMRRGLGTLAILAAVAPLLGLLGTVVGIIETFQAITLFGTGDPRLMSGGISLALVTTVMGLVVAIPLLILHSLLTSRSNGLVQVLDQQGAALVARVSEQRDGR